MPDNELDFEAESDFSGIKSFLGKFGTGSASFRATDSPWFQTATENLAEQLLQELIAATPVKSGMTAYDWRRSGTEIRNDNPRIHWLEFGVSEHIIRATNSDLLRFQGRDGSWVAVPVVHHPGITRGLGFVRIAVQEFFARYPEMRGRINVTIYDGIQVEQTWSWRGRS